MTEIKVKVTSSALSQAPRAQLSSCLSVCQRWHQEFSRRPWGSSVKRKTPPPAPVTLPVEMLRGSERLASSLPSDCLMCSDASSLSVGSILCLIASERTQGNSPQPIHQYAMHVHLLRQRKYPEGCRGSRCPRFKCKGRARRDVCIPLPTRSGPLSLLYLGKRRWGRKRG